MREILINKLREIEDITVDTLTAAVSLDIQTIRRVLFKLTKLENCCDADVQQIMVEVILEEMGRSEREIKHAKQNVLLITKYHFSNLITNQLN